MVTDLFTPAELAQVAAYHRPTYVSAALGELLNPLIAVLWMRYGVRPLYGLAERHAASPRWARIGRLPVLRAGVKVMDRLWKGGDWGAALLFTLYGYVVFLLPALPLHIYFGYFREHAYGLSSYTALHYATDFLKGTVFEVAIKLSVAVGLYGMARRTRHWWAITGVVAVILMQLSGALDPFRARVYVEQRPLPAGALRERLTTLLAQGHVEYRDILVDQTSRATRKVNAYFAGRGATRTVVLSDTLVDTFPPEEIAAAIAHEAGHVQDDRRVREVLAALSLILFLFTVDRLLRFAARRGWFGATQFADIRTLPLLSLTMYLVLTVGGPISGYFAREREWAADRYGIALTGDPRAFASMLVRVARVNKMDPAPPRWFILRGEGHPPIVERIEAAEASIPAAPVPTVPAPTVGRGETGG